MADEAVVATESESTSLGISAPDKFTFQIVLNRPDKDLPQLVANPIFSPVFSTTQTEDIGVESSLVSNGAFHVTSVSDGSVVLEKSDTYWDADSVELQRVHFVSLDDPEKALQAYRAGDIDAVTNSEFSPLMLKLLEPYEDFRRTTHGTLNYYQLNLEKPYLKDRRVREALAISIERDRLTQGDLEGMSQPALRYMPYGTDGNSTLIPDRDRARQLMTDAGYKDGGGFPVIKLLVNRNDTQQRVARAVSRMWKENLNLDTEIVVKDSGELESMRLAGDYDVMRRGAVMPTTDELVNLASLFGWGTEPSQTAKPSGSVATAAKPSPTDLPGEVGGSLGHEPKTGPLAARIRIRSPTLNRKARLFTN